MKKMTKYVIQGSNQLSWQKYCQIRLKGEEIGQNEGKLSDFWDSTSSKWSNRTTWPVNVCCPSSKGENDFEGGSETIRATRGLEGKLTTEG